MSGGSATRLAPGAEPQETGISNGPDVVFKASVYPEQFPMAVLILTHTPVSSRRVPLDGEKVVLHVHADPAHEVGPTTVHCSDA
jgi:hypothetical protein